MYAYYIVRGHTLEYLLSLSNLDKMFFRESMQYQMEMEVEKHNAIFGK